MLLDFFVCLFCLFYFSQGGAVRAGSLGVVGIKKKKKKETYGVVMALFLDLLILRFLSLVSSATYCLFPKYPIIESPFFFLRR